MPSGCSRKAKRYTNSAIKLSVKIIALRPEKVKKMGQNEAPYELDKDIKVRTWML